MSEKLSSAQREFATLHHGLIYKLLNTKGLPVDDYYDVVVFGYLRAVKKYTEQSELQRFSFSTIAYRDMKQELYNHYRSLNRFKRKAVVYSLETEVESGRLLHERIASPSPNVYDYAELREQWETAKQSITPAQMAVLEMRSQGYSTTEIAEACNTTSSGVYGRIYRIRKTIRPLLAA